MAKQPESFTDKMTRIDRASREIIAKETVHRDQKTARLRALRLAQNEASQPLPVKRRSPRSKTERIRADLDSLH